MNKLQVGLDEVGRIHLSRAGYCNGIYTLETTEALRAFFQAERDEELDRWRDTENPDYVVYPGSVSLDWVVVLDESTGGTNVVFKQPRKPTKDSDFRLVADRYFATHLDPEPRPWEEAKAGEYWLVILEGADPIPTTVGNYCENLYFVVGDDDYYCPTNDHRIQNAVRLTPEDGDCGISEPTKEGGLP